MRRLLIAIAVVFLGASSAAAKPRAAVTPVGGDADDEMGAAVREALGGELAVVAAKDVERAMSKLGLSGELEESDAQRLGQKLDAAVVVQGKLGRAGQKKTVKLTVWVKGKKPSDFNVQYKTATSEKFREAVHDALMKRIGSVSELGEEEKPKRRLSDDDEERPKKKRLSDGEEEKPKKKRLSDGEEEKPKKKLADGDEEKPKKKLSDGDEERPKKKVASAEEDEDKPKVRKRKRGEDGDGEGVQAQPARPLPAARVDVGGAYGARSLTYAVAADSMSKPPRVLTPAPSGRIEAEVYPLAFSDRESPLAGIGIFGEFDKTFGLSIDVPRTMGKSAAIDQSHYAVGALYRLALGRSAISGGLAYARRHYIADRSKLETPTQLDAPDVDYAAVSPVVGARTQVASRLSLFAEASVMLVMSAGGIAKSDSYGAGDVFGFGGNGGIDVALGKQLGLRFAGELNQIKLSFKGTGTLASTRRVSAATDREYGGSATLAAWF